MIISVFLNSGKLVQNCLRNNGVVATEKRAPIVSIIGINQIHHHILQSEQKLFNINIASNFLSPLSHRFGDILTKRTKTRMVNIYFSSISMKHEHIFSISSISFFLHRKAEQRRMAPSVELLRGADKQVLMRTYEDIYNSPSYLISILVHHRSFLHVKEHQKVHKLTTK